MRTVEHIAEVHEIAAARRAKGQNVWAFTVKLGDVFHDDSKSFIERRDEIVRRLRTSRWLYGRDEPDSAMEALEGLAGAEDAKEFDGWLDELYDCADWERCWIDTTTPRAAT